MKVKEALEILQEQDPEAELHIAVQSHTRVYPVGYFEPWKIYKAWDNTVRINVTLPAGFVISERKAK